MLVDSPVRLFVLSEAEIFNETVAMIMDHTSRQRADVIESLAKGVTPDEWRDSIGCVCALSPTKFVAYLKEKVAMLQICVKSGKLPQIVDIRQIGNIKGLFDAYFAECAIAMGLDVEALDMVFSPVEMGARMDGLALTNCWFMNAGYNYDRQVLLEPDAPFQRIEKLICRVITKFAEESKFACPMFRSIPSRICALNSDFERVDGEVRNFIRYIYFDTGRVPHWKFVVNGTAVICHMSELFG
jgi:hypothetical protein